MLQMGLRCGHSFHLSFVPSSLGRTLPCCVNLVSKGKILIRRRFDLLDSSNLKAHVQKLILHGALFRNLMLCRDR